MEINEMETTPILQDKTVPHKHKSTVKRCITVEPAAILSIIYMAGVLPWTQQYVYHRLGEDENLISIDNHTLCLEGLEFNDSTFLTGQDVQRKTIMKLASYNAVSLLPLLCSSIILGSLSDLIGRKLVLLIPVIGACARVGVTSFVVLYKLSLNYLYLAVILESLLGGPVVFLGVVYAYISDITTEGERAFRIIVIELCVAIGVIVSMIGIGILITFQGFFIPIAVLIGCCLLNIFYICFGIQESRQTKNNQKIHTWSLTIHRNIFLLYKKDNGRGRRWRLFVALFLFLLVAVGELGKVDVTVLYVLAYPFCFTPIAIGIYAALAFLSSGIGAVVITKLLQKRLHEMVFYIIGSISSLTSCILLGLARSTLLIFIACLANVFGRLQMGMLRSYLSKIVEEKELGILFTSMAWLDQAAIVVGSVVFNIIYAGTLSLHSGFVFFFIAGLFFVGIVIAGIVAIIEAKVED